MPKLCDVPASLNKRKIQGCFFHMLLYIKLLWKMQSTSLGMKGVTVGDEKIVPDAWICSALAEKKYMDIG